MKILMQLSRSERIIARNLVVGSIAGHSWFSAGLPVLKVMVKD
jgi:hypothetical protein